MSTSADLVQIGIIKEVTYGVTPATPAFDVLPISSESLAAEVNTQDSAMMNPEAQTVDNHLLGFDPGGDLAMELSDNPAVRTLLESAMRNSLTVVPATQEPVGAPLNPNLYEADLKKERVSFTVEKRFPDPQNPGQHLYQRITGVVVDVMQIAMEAEGVVEGTFSVIGKEFSEASSALAGATYNLPGESRIWRGVDVVKLSIGSIMDGVLTDCGDGLNINLNLNMRGKKCLGTLGNREVLIGTSTLEITLQRGYLDNAFLQALLAQTEHDFSVQLSVPNIAGDGVNWLAFDAHRVKVSGDPVVAGGTGTDVVDDLTLAGLLSETEATSLTAQIGEGATS